MQARARLSTLELAVVHLCVVERLTSREASNVLATRPGAEAAGCEARDRSPVTIRNILAVATYKLGGVDRGGPAASFITVPRPDLLAA